LVDPATWLPDSTEKSVRDAVARVAPDLAVRRVVVTPKAKQPNPLYWSGSAIVDGRFAVKFAWAEAPAIRVWREGALLQRLAATDSDLAIPRVTHLSRRPAVAITEVVDGKPMSWEWASERRPAETRRLGAAIGAFLARLHAVPAAPVLDDLPPYVPAPQADTARLRTRYPHLVDDHRARLVRQWCDWVDDALARRSADLDVLVHGDFHGHNQLWDHYSFRLASVLDFEETGIAEPEFDFRYLPGNSRTPELALSAVAAYEQRASRGLDLRRVLAWNVRTHLGDALWRTEAQVALPGGGDASTWVDDLAARLSDFGFRP
jgi:aminoglycoside phosphotransferase (APT) family kinase protein